MLFGNKLRAARLSAGLTQEELAERCGMKKQNVSRYETSDREPNVRTAKKMADALGVTLEDLITDIEKPAPRFESELDAELIRLLQQLEPEEEQKVLAFVQGLIANRRA